MIDRLDQRVKIERRVAAAASDAAIPERQAEIKPFDLAVPAAL